MKNMVTFIKYACLWVLFCSFSELYGQNGGMLNNWFFGDHLGLSFNTGSPVLMSGPIDTSEGVAVVSDVNGNLIFSTDGTYVYNKLNVQMPNGFGLWGHPSATQSATIVPYPGNPNLYYIFTVVATAGTFGQPYSGVAYSVVDLSLNGGLGDVTTKNVQLVHPAPEKLTAAKHCNGSDYWLICHGWNSSEFYAYQITAAGISAPVVSNVGSYYESPSGGNSETLGYIKLSPNGKKLVAVLTYVLNSSVEIFDFDNATGILSNPFYIPGPGGGYGVSFSPNNSKLYIGSFTEGLIQYDLTAANVPASLYVLDDYSLYGAVQAGPDGKLYAVPYNTPPLSIGIISNPNVAGVGCNYNHLGIILPTNTAFFGLPNFSDPIIASTLYVGPDLVLCGGGSVTLQANTSWASYVWSTGDTTQSITVTQAGTYWVEVPTDCGNLLRDTIVVNPPALPVNLGNDTVLSCGAGASIVLNAGGNNLGAYSWSTGATSQSISVNTGGTYWVNVTDACGTSSDTVMVLPFSSSVDFLTDTFYCKSSTVTLYADSGYSSYEWITGDVTQSLVVGVAGVYWVNMTDGNGCVVTDSLTVVLNPNSVPNAGFNIVNASNGNGTYTTTFTYSSVATNLQSYWDFGDGTTSDSLSPLPHVFQCGVNFEVMHIVWNECGRDTFSMNVYEACHVGVEEHLGQHFELYPNPLVGDILILKGIEGDVVFALYDVMGKRVFLERVSSKDNSVNLPMELGNGVYVAKLLDVKSNRMWNGKVVIMR